MVRNISSLIPLAKRYVPYGIPVVTAGIGLASYHHYSQKAPYHQPLAPKDRGGIMRYAGGMLAGSALSAALMRPAWRRLSPKSSVLAATGTTLLSTISGITGLFGGLTLQPLLTNRVPSFTPQRPIPVPKGVDRYNI